MAIAYTKVKGQGAIESGYLKRIGSEDGYTSYQFYGDLHRKLVDLSTR
jgi:hypothetical protein